VPEALDRAGWSLADIDRIEINEAPVARERGLPEDIVNVEGGAFDGLPIHPSVENAHLSSTAAQKLIGDAGVTYLTTSRKISKADVSVVAVSLLVASTTIVTPLARS
jgi:hypothetical protein